ncbi:unnamed protein product [Amoebophrya sp. A120]|nr:unnamed protein product [Amoebophrya sp. A120]|eukprot:GSA120T00015544001.1
MVRNYNKSEARARESLGARGRTQERNSVASLHFAKRVLARLYEVFFWLFASLLESLRELVSSLLVHARTAIARLCCGKRNSGGIGRGDHRNNLLRAGSGSTGHLLHTSARRKNQARRGGCEYGKGEEEDHAFEDALVEHLVEVKKDETQRACPPPAPHEGNKVKPPVLGASRHDDKKQSGARSSRKHKDKQGKKGNKGPRGMSISRSSNMGSGGIVCTPSSSLDADAVAVQQPSSSADHQRRKSCDVVEFPVVQIAVDEAKAEEQGESSVSTRRRSSTSTRLQSAFSTERTQTAGTGTIKSVLPDEKAKSSEESRGTNPIKEDDAKNKSSLSSTAGAPTTTTARCSTQDVTPPPEQQRSVKDASSSTSATTQREVDEGRLQASTERQLSSNIMTAALTRAARFSMKSCSRSFCPEFVTRTIASSCSRASNFFTRSEDCASTTCSEEVLRHKITTSCATGTSTSTQSGGGSNRSTEVASTVLSSVLRPNSPPATTSGLRPPAGAPSLTTSTAHLPSAASSVEGKDEVMQRGERTTTTNQKGLSYKNRKRNKKKNSKRSTHSTHEDDEERSVRHVLGDQHPAISRGPATEVVAGTSTLGKKNAARGTGEMLSVMPASSTSWAGLFSPASKNVMKLFLVLLCSMLLVDARQRMLRREPRRTVALVETSNPGPPSSLGSSSSSSGDSNRGTSAEAGSLAQTSSTPGALAAGAPQDSVARTLVTVTTSVLASLFGWDEGGHGGGISAVERPASSSSSTIESSKNDPPGAGAGRDVSKSTSALALESERSLSNGDAPAVDSTDGISAGSADDSAYSGQKSMLRSPTSTTEDEVSAGRGAASGAENIPRGYETSSPQRTSTATDEAFGPGAPEDAAVKKNDEEQTSFLSSVEDKQDDRSGAAIARTTEELSGGSSSSSPAAPTATPAPPSGHTTALFADGGRRGVAANTEDHLSLHQEAGVSDDQVGPAAGQTLTVPRQKDADASAAHPAPAGKKIASTSQAQVPGGGGGGTTKTTGTSPPSTANKPVAKAGGDGGKTDGATENRKKMNAAGQERGPVGKRPATHFSDDEKQRQDTLFGAVGELQLLSDESSAASSEGAAAAPDFSSTSSTSPTSAVDRTTPAKAVASSSSTSKPSAAPADAEQSTGVHQQQPEAQELAAVVADDVVAAAAHDQNGLGQHAGHEESDHHQHDEGLQGNEKPPTPAIVHRGPTAIEPPGPVVERVDLPARPEGNLNDAFATSSTLERSNKKPLDVESEASHGNGDDDETAGAGAAGGRATPESASTAQSTSDSTPRQQEAGPKRSAALDAEDEMDAFGLVAELRRDSLQIEDTGGIIDKQDPPPALPVDDEDDHVHHADGASNSPSPSNIPDPDEHEDQEVHGDLEREMLVTGHSGRAPVPTAARTAVGEQHTDDDKNSQMTQDQQEDPAVPPPGGVAHTARNYREEKVISNDDNGNGSGKSGSASRTAPAPAAMSSSSTAAAAPAASSAETGSSSTFSSASRTSASSSASSALVPSSTDGREGNDEEAEATGSAAKTSASDQSHIRTTPPTSTARGAENAGPQQQAQAPETAESATALASESTNPPGSAVETGRRSGGAMPQQEAHGAEMRKTQGDLDKILGLRTSMEDKGPSSKSKSKSRIKFESKEKGGVVPPEEPGLPEQKQLAIKNVNGVITSFEQLKAAYEQWSKLEKVAVETSRPNQDRTFVQFVLDSKSDPEGKRKELREELANFILDVAASFLLDALQPPEDAEELMDYIAGELEEEKEGLRKKMEMGGKGTEIENEKRIEQLVKKLLPTKITETKVNERTIQNFSYKAAKFPSRATTQDTPRATFFKNGVEVTEDIAKKVFEEIKEALQGDEREQGEESSPSNHLELPTAGEDKANAAPNAVASSSSSTPPSGINKEESLAPPGDVIGSQHQEQKETSTGSLVPALAPVSSPDPGGHQIRPVSFLQEAQSSAGGPKAALATLFGPVGRIGKRIFSGFSSNQKAEDAKQAEEVRKRGRKLLDRLVEQKLPEVQQWLNYLAEQLVVQDGQGGPPSNVLTAALTSMTGNDANKSQLLTKKIELLSLLAPVFFETLILSLQLSRQMAAEADKEQASLQKRTAPASGEQTRLQVVADGYVHALATNAGAEEKEIRDKAKVGLDLALQHIEKSCSSPAPQAETSPTPAAAPTRRANGIIGFGCNLVSKTGIGIGKWGVGAVLGLAHPFRKERDGVTPLGESTTGIDETAEDEEEEEESSDRDDLQDEQEGRPRVAPARQEKRRHLFRSLRASLVYPRSKKFREGFRYLGWRGTTKLAEKEVQKQFDLATGTRAPQPQSKFAVYTARLLAGAAGGNVAVAGASSVGTQLGAGLGRPDAERIAGLASQYLELATDLMGLCTLLFEAAASYYLSPVLPIDLFLLRRLVGPAIPIVKTLGDTLIRFKAGETTVQQSNEDAQAAAKSLAPALLNGMAQVADAYIGVLVPASGGEQVRKVGRRVSKVMSTFLFGSSQPQERKTASKVVAEGVGLSVDDYYPPGWRQDELSLLASDLFHGAVLFKAMEESEQDKHQGLLSRLPRLISFRESLAARRGRTSKEKPEHGAIRWTHLSAAALHACSFSASASGQSKSAESIARGGAELHEGSSVFNSIACGVLSRQLVPKTIGTDKYDESAEEARSLYPIGNVADFLEISDHSIFSAALKEFHLAGPTDVRGPDEGTRFNSVEGAKDVRFLLDLDWISNDVDEQRAGSQKKPGATVDFDEMALGLLSAPDCKRAVAHLIFLMGVKTTMENLKKFHLAPRPHMVAANVSSGTKKRLGEITATIVQLDAVKKNRKAAAAKAKAKASASGAQPSAPGGVTKNVKKRAMRAAAFLVRKLVFTSGDAAEEQQQLPELPLETDEGVGNGPGRFLQSLLDGLGEQITQMSQKIQKDGAQGGPQAQGEVSGAAATSAVVTQATNDGLFEVYQIEERTSSSSSDSSTTGAARRSTDGTQSTPPPRNGNVVVDVSSEDILKNYKAFLGDWGV